MGHPVHPLCNCTAGLATQKCRRVVGQVRGVIAQCAFSHTEISTAIGISAPINISSGQSWSIHSWSRTKLHEPEAKSFACKSLQPMHHHHDRCLPCLMLQNALPRRLVYCNDYEASTTGNGAGVGRGVPFPEREGGDACIGARSGGR